MPSASEHLELALRHLARAQVASAAVDWPDLALYGFYCLENAVVAAAMHVGLAITKSHTAKATAARELAARHHLPNIADLLVQLNDARKAEAYGDTARPDLDPAELGRTLHGYVSAVEALLAR